MTKSGGRVSPARLVIPYSVEGMRVLPTEPLVTPYIAIQRLILLSWDLDQFIKLPSLTLTCWTRIAEEVNTAKTENLSAIGPSPQ